jgi:hypothetical protein
MTSLEHIHIQNVRRSLDETIRLTEISLFEKINIDRSCLDALIPYKYCDRIFKTDLNELEMIEETGHGVANVSQLIINEERIVQQERKISQVETGTLYFVKDSSSGWSKD